uniref:hypothetical protein n=1 Tax=uncultured Rubinisphaera sp. TaxID=1678686 RepID=UPI0030D975F6
KTKLKSTLTGGPKNGVHFRGRSGHPPNTMGCSACEEGLRRRKEQEKTELRTRNVTKWSVGVTTAPREQPTLERSLISLAEVGFETPRLFAEPGTEIPGSHSRLSSE